MYVIHVSYHHTEWAVDVCVTDMSNSDGSHKVDSSLWFQRLQGFEYFVLVCGQCHVYLGTGRNCCQSVCEHVCVCLPHSASDRSPTVFSTFCLVFIRHTTFTASC